MILRGWHNGSEKTVSYEIHALSLYHFFYDGPLFQKDQNNSNEKENIYEISFGPQVVFEGDSLQCSAFHAD